MNFTLKRVTPKIFLPLEDGRYEIIAAAQMEEGGQLTMLSEFILKNATSILGDLEPPTTTSKWKIVCTSLCD